MDQFSKLFLPSRKLSSVH